MKATKQLMDEHAGIKYMLEILHAISEELETKNILNKDDFSKVIEFLKVFVDKCHHGKEEDVLFPAIEKAGVPKEGGPIGVMLSEHENGRHHIKAISEAFERYKNNDKKAGQIIVEHIRAYSALLEQHIEKEDNVLYKLADANLNDSIQDELYEEFKKIEEDRIGHGKHEEFHRWMEELGNKYLKD